MAIRNVVKKGESILSKKARKVEVFNNRLDIMLEDMIDTLYETGGIGLAAPQIGILRRIVVIDIGEGLIELINPEIIEESGTQEEIEGCLSCPQEWGVTKRPLKVTVKAYDRKGEEFTVSGEGLLARAFCHEIDHLNGVLFLSKVIRKVSPEEIKAVGEN